MYKLKSLDELAQSINMGMDIEFYAYGTRYNISWRDNRPFICICPDGDAIFYDSPDEMLKEYAIHGKRLVDIWRDLEIISM